MNLLATYRPLPEDESGLTTAADLFCGSGGFGIENGREK